MIRKRIRLYWTSEGGFGRRLLLLGWLEAEIEAAYGCRKGIFGGPETDDFLAEPTDPWDPVGS